MTLVYLTLAWCGGILLGHWLWSQGWIGCATPRWPWGAAAALLALLVVLFRKRPSYRLVVALALLAALGAWRYAAHPLYSCTSASDIAFYNGDPAHPAWVTVEGVVRDDPVVGDGTTEYRLAVETLTEGASPQPVRGTLLVRAAAYPVYPYGTRLRAMGLLEAPPRFDDFDYRAYLARQGVYSQMLRSRLTLVAGGQGNWFWTTLYGLRAAGAALLDRVLPEPAAALANGMLLGIEAGISAPVKEAYQASGASHVIVISGSNIALFSAVLLAALARALGKRRATVPVIACIGLYVLLVGADASALRAGLMGGLYVFSIALGRQNTAFVSLFASALLMTLINPLTLWDIGFELSFMATLGLIVFAQPLGAWLAGLLPGRRAGSRLAWASSLLKDTLAVTLAAQIATLPVLMYNFGRLSVVSLLTNLLILPAQPPILIGGMVTLLAGLVWLPLARVCAIIPWLFLAYTTFVVRLLASLSFAAIDTGTLGRPLALLTGVLFLGFIIVRRLRQSGLALPPTGRIAIVAAALVVPLWLGPAVLRSLPDGRLHVFFVAAGGGEAAFLVTPRGRLVCTWDGRGDAAALAQAVRAALPGGWSRDTVALGPAARLCPSGRVVSAVDFSPGASAQLDAGVIVRRLRLAEEQPGRGETGLDWPLIATYGDFRTLLTPALPPATQAGLLAASTDLSTTLLKAPAAGSAAWPQPEYLAASAAQVVLWPDGTTYPPDALEALATRPVVHVSADAVIEVITDGAQIWLQQWRGSTEE